MAGAVVSFPRVTVLTCVAMMVGSRALVVVAIVSFVRVGSVLFGFVEGVVVIIVGIVADRRLLPVARRALVAVV